MPSYSPVFSQAFINYTAGTPNNAFDVPEGYTAVVRQISVTQDIGGWYAYCDIQDSESAPTLTIWIAEAAGLINYAAGEGRWVVPGGGVITINVETLGAQPSMYVGGYLLRNTLT